jgi:hypothetical protein
MENTDKENNLKKEEKPIKLSGNFLYYDNKNLNNRIYTRKMSEDIIEQFNKKIEEEGVFFGELGYPGKDNFTGIDLSNVSHEVEEIHLNEEQKSLAGTIKLLDTDKGKIVKELLKEGSPLSISCRPRGVGDVNENNEIENFEIISFDLVPGPDAFENIKSENDLNLLEEE